MVVETGIIKGKKSKYYNKSEDKEIIKYSKTINLGVNSSCNIDDNVIILSETDYKELIATNETDIKATETIKELNNIIVTNENRINKLSDEVEELKTEILKLTNENNINLSALTDLTNDYKATEIELTEVKRVMKQYNINNADDLQQLFKLFEFMEIDYIRVINYYETDQMHVVHHSNYARYLEEARLHMMDQLDLSYDELERMGIIIPVMELHDYYIKSITYGDIIEIRPLIIRLSPVRFSLKYDISGIIILII